MQTLTAEVEAIVNVIELVGQSIKKMGTGWFSSGRETDECKASAKNLVKKLGSCIGLIQIQAVMDDKQVKQILEIITTSVKSLDKEAAELEAIEMHCCMRYSRSPSLGPLTATLEKLRSSLLNLLPLLQEIAKSSKLRELNPEVESSKLPFGSNPRYVPLRETIALVKEAVENTGGPQIVTISGGPGAGKTALVKHLALHYQEKLDNLVKSQRSERGTTQSGPDSGPEMSFPNGVFYLACGRGADSRVKIIELLHGLDPFLQLPSREGNEAQSHGESALRDRLRARLEEKAALLILDDVWDPAFLERIAVPANRVKYLVTTREEKLLTGSSSVSIPIQKPSLDEARRILANHIVDLPEQIIPSELQEVADDMIKAAESNSLVLANLGVVISEQRPSVTDGTQWKVILKNFLHLLDGDKYSLFGPVFFGERLPKVVACSIPMAMDSIPSVDQNLLCLAVLCEGPAVPEVVLSLLHRSTSKGPLNVFSNCTNYLEKRGFIELQDYVVPWSTSHRRIWSIHSMRQHCIRSMVSMEEDINLLVNTLLAVAQSNGAGSMGDYNFCIDDMLVAALCYIYCERELSDKAAAKLQITSTSSAAERQLLRKTLEPVVWLLHVDHEIEEEWEQRAYWSARKVLIRYICDGILDDEAVSNLLSIPQTAPAMCRTLQTMGETNEKPVLTTDVSQTIQSLLKLLVKDADKSFEVQRRAADAVSFLADKNYNSILADPCTLERLTRLLSKDVKSVAQEGAAVALGKLAVTDDIRHKIATYPGVLARLVELLDKTNCCRVQEISACTLSTLALSPANIHRMAEFPGALQSLGQLLDKEINAAVQLQAARALANLASMDKITHRIAVSPGILDAAVQLLGDGIRPDVQSQGARLLANLSAVKENQSMILRLPGGIRSMVMLLESRSVSGTSSQSVVAQENAAKVLLHLSSAKENRLTIANFPGALKVLMEQASNDANPELQKCATRSLENLAATAAGLHRASPSSSGSTAMIQMTPADRQMLDQMLSRNPSPRDEDHPPPGRESRRSSIDDDSRELSWAVVKQIKARWMRMLYRCRIKMSPRSNSIRDSCPPPSSFLPATPHGSSLIGVQLPCLQQGNAKEESQTKSTVPKELHNLELDLSPSMREKLGAPLSSFRRSSPEHR